METGYEVRTTVAVRSEKSAEAIVPYVTLSMGRAEP